MPTTRVFVGGVTPTTTESELNAHFSVCGSIDKIEIRPGFAFVYYNEAEDASSAIRTLHQSELNGKRIVVEESRVKGQKEGTAKSGKEVIIRHEHRYRVHGLNRNTTWSDLKDWARGGDKQLIVTFANVAMTSEGAVGVIEFGSQEDFEKAPAALQDLAILGANVTLTREVDENGDMLPSLVIISRPPPSRSNRDDRRQNNRGGDSRYGGDYRGGGGGDYRGGGGYRDDYRGGPPSDRYRDGPGSSYDDRSRPYYRDSYDRPGPGAPSGGGGGGGGYDSYRSGPPSGPPRGRSRSRDRYGGGGGADYRSGPPPSSYGGGGGGGGSSYGGIDRGRYDDLPPSRDYSDSRGGGAVGRGYGSGSGGYSSGGAGGGSSAPLSSSYPPRDHDPAGGYRDSRDRAYSGGGVGLGCGASDYNRDGPDGGRRY